MKYRQRTFYTDKQKSEMWALSDDIFMLTWIEAGGPALSNVLRLTDNTLVTHANIGRNVFVNLGRLTVTSGFNNIE